MRKTIRVIAFTMMTTGAGILFVDAVVTEVQKGRLYRAEQKVYDEEFKKIIEKY